MQFPTIVSIIALVGLTNALPAANGGGSGGSGGSGGASCPSSSTQYCCDSASILNVLGLTCTLSSLLGTTCSSQTICCVNSVCTESDGSPVTVPITVTVPISIL